MCINLCLAILPGGIRQIIICIRFGLVKTPETVGSPCSRELAGEGILGIQYIFKSHEKSPPAASGLNVQFRKCCICADRSNHNGVISRI